MKLFNVGDKMKRIVVRKPMGEKLGIAFLTIVMAAAMMFFVLYVDLEPKIYILGLFSLGFITQLIFLIYYLSWKIIVGKEEIRKEVLFKAWKKYSFQEIKTVEILYHYNMRQYVRIKFSDGKRIRFRLEDENSSKAINLLCKRFSIKDRTM